MKRVLLLDTSVGSDNKGDDIIMECLRDELSFILNQSYEMTLPTHVSPFHWYQVFRNSSYLHYFSDCNYKFVGGTNLLIPNLLTHFPQWNINLFNYLPLKGSILVGVGAGADYEDVKGIKAIYTKHLYKNLLNRTIKHSARDSRTKVYLDSLGIDSINTGCVTTWKLTPAFCKSIPRRKADSVVFTLTASPTLDLRDQELIDVLLRNYHAVYYWPQGVKDYEYFNLFKNIQNIQIISSSKDSYRDFLMSHEVDYVGTRLHAGIYALRHHRRSIIIVIDERARAINSDINLPSIEKTCIGGLDDMINSAFSTDIKIDLETISEWKKQFA